MGRIADLPVKPDEGSMKTKAGTHPVARRVFAGIIRLSGDSLSNKR